jgi:hypothetical protein
VRNCRAQVFGRRAGRGDVGRIVARRVALGKTAAGAAIGAPHHHDGGPAAARELRRVRQDGKRRHAPALVGIARRAVRDQHRRKAPGRVRPHQRGFESVRFRAGHRDAHRFPQNGACADAAPARAPMMTASSVRRDMIGPRRSVRPVLGVSPTLLAQRAAPPEHGQVYRKPNGLQHPCIHRVRGRKAGGHPDARPGQAFS